MKQLVDWTEVVLDTLGYIQTFHGLTKTVTRPDEENNPQRYPAKIGSEETPINFEDKFAYLRVGQITDSELDDEACGKRISRTFPLTLVVGLPNDVLSNPDEYIALKVAQNISNSLQVTTTKALREAISAEGVEVSVSNIITDSYEIWTTERNDDYAYPTDHFLISMLVSFVIDGHISCFEILGCDDEPAQMLQAYVDCDGTEKRWPFGEKIICTQCAEVAFCDAFTAASVADIETCFDSQSGGRQTAIQEAICIPCTNLQDYTCLQLNNASTGLTQAQRDAVQKAIPLKTGQTTSYAVGFQDDGDLQKGRQAGFLTLTCNNPSGNTNRFEDNGDGTVTDWATGRMWSKAFSATDVTWEAAGIAAEASVLAGYTDWRLPTIQEYVSILNFGETAMFNYPPFNIIANTLWSMTTVDSATGSAWCGGGTVGINSADKTTTQFYMLIRDL